MINNFSPTLFKHVQKHYVPKAINILGKIFKGKRKVVHHSYVSCVEYPYYEKRTIKKIWPDTVITKGKLPPDIFDALPIKPSSTARFIGIVNTPVGHRPQKFTHADPLFAHKELNWFAVEAVKHCEYRVTASGAWPTQIINFQELCNPVKEIDIEHYLAAAKKRAHKIKLPFIGEGVIPDEILSVGTKPKSSAGFLSSIFIGPNHRSCDSVIKPVAKQVFEEVLENYIVDRSLWTIGGRGRANKITPTAGDPMKSRVVLMPEGVSKIIALAASNAWMRNIVAINKENVTNEIGVGLDFMNDRYLDYSSYVNKFEIQGEVDWKAFDTTVTEDLLLLAMAIIRGCFPDGEEYDRLFIYQASSLIFKNVVIPGGYVFRLSKSIPSGSPWTTALGCIVNWLTWAAVFSEVENDTHVTCYGDDTVFGAKVDGVMNHCFNEHWLAMRIKQVSPLVPKGFKIFDKDINPTPYEGPTLLKAYSFGNQPARTQEDFYSTILFGGGSGLRRARSYWDLHMKTRGALYNNPFNPKLEEPLRLLQFHTYMITHKSWVVHPSAWNEADTQKEANTQFNNSKRIAYNRYLQPENLFTPKVKVALPWLDEQKYYEKFFIVNVKSLLLRNVYFDADKVVNDRVISYGTRLIDRQLHLELTAPSPEPPPKRKKVSLEYAIAQNLKNIHAGKVTDLMETLELLDNWALSNNYYIEN